LVYSERSMCTCYKSWMSHVLEANVLFEKDWLGNKDVALHSGEGPIGAIKWRGRFIAWANDLVYSDKMFAHFPLHWVLTLNIAGCPNIRCCYRTTDHIHCSVTGQPACRALQMSPLLER